MAIRPPQASFVLPARMNETIFGTKPRLFARHHGRPSRHDARAFIQALRLLVGGARAERDADDVRASGREDFVEPLGERLVNDLRYVVKVEPGVALDVALPDCFADSGEEAGPADVDGLLALDGNTRASGLAFAWLALAEDGQRLFDERQLVSLAIFHPVGGDEDYAPV